MARHGSQSSQSERQIPPSPRSNNRGPVSGPYPYQYSNQPTFTPGGGYNQGIPGRGGNYRNPSGSAPSFQPVMQQFQRTQPPRSPHQQNIPLGSQPLPTPPQSMYNMQHVQGMTQQASYVNPPFPQYPPQYMDLTRGDMQYIPASPDQYGQQMPVQGPYMYQPQFQQQPQQPQHGFPNAPPQQQLFSTPAPPTCSVYSLSSSESTNVSFHKCCIGS